VPRTVLICVSPILFQSVQKVVLGTALHTSKDLAVSPNMLPYLLFHSGIPLLSLWTSLLAPLFRLRKDGYYPLPFSTMHVQHGCVRTFLPAPLFIVVYIQPIHLNEKWCWAIICVFILYNINILLQTFFNIFWQNPWR
jgi:hypothetical protein